MKKYMLVVSEDIGAGWAITRSHFFPFWTIAHLVGRLYQLNAILKGVKVSASIYGGRRVK